MASASERVVKVRAELGNAVIVRPGDKLVIGTPGRLTQHEAETIKARIAEKLPGVEAVIIDSCSGLAVYRPDELPPLAERLRMEGIHEGTIAMMTAPD